MDKKRNAAPPSASSASSSAKKIKKELGIFTGVHAVLIEKGIGAVRSKIIKERFVAQGGVIEPAISSSTLYIVSCLPYEKALAALHLKNLSNSPSVVVVSSEWVSDSLRDGKQHPIEKYLIKKPGELPAVKLEPDLVDTKPIVKSAVVRKRNAVTASPPMKLRIKFDPNDDRPAENVSQSINWDDPITLEDEEPVPDVQIKAEPPHDSEEEKAANTRRSNTVQFDIGPSWLRYQSSGGSAEEDEAADEEFLRNLPPSSQIKNIFASFETPSSAEHQGPSHSGNSSLSPPKISSSSASPAPSPRKKLGPLDLKEPRGLGTKFNYALAKQNPFFKALIPVPSSSSASSGDSPKKSSSPTVSPTMAPPLSPPSRDLTQLYEDVNEFVSQRDPSTRIKQEDEGGDETIPASSARDRDVGSETDDRQSDDEVKVVRDTKGRLLAQPSTIPIKPYMNRKKNYFVCQKGSSGMAAKVNHNKAITDILEKLEATAKATGDHWRSYAYRKAITALKNHPREITRVEEARSIRGVGERIADKIAEILETGRLRKAEVKDEYMEVFELFSKIWGAGPETVKKWFAKGYRTLRDLELSNDLNHQQSVGLKYYHDLQQRIPRKEVQVIENIVLKCAKSINPNIKMVVCGSYRRGKPDCGDIDCLFTNTAGDSLDGLLEELVARLKQTGLILADLTNVDPLKALSGAAHKSSEYSDKYFGVCSLPGGTARRIDFQIIAVQEWPFALMYFTGSDHFNRSMRLWAKKNGYSLSEKALVPRLGGDMKGAPLPNIDTEEAIFAALGLKCTAAISVRFCEDTDALFADLPPEERNV